jgi:hypothetical protein
VVLFGPAHPGISGKFDSRGESDGDCDYLVGFFVRCRGLCESMMQIIENERDDDFVYLLPHIIPGPLGR